MRKGDEVQIIGGPRDGQVGKVSMLASNGAIVAMPDGKYHTVKFEHLKPKDICESAPFPKCNNAEGCSACEYQKEDE